MVPDGEDNPETGPRFAKLFEVKHEHRKER